MQGKEKQEVKGKARKLHMMKRQKHLCIWCGLQMQMRKHDRDDYATWEHLVPTSLGGLDFVKEFEGKMLNLAIAHRKCNNLRSSNMTWMPCIPLSKLQERALRCAQYKLGIRFNLTRMTKKQSRTLARKNNI